MQTDEELNDIYVLDGNDGDKAIAYTAWSKRVRTYPLPWFYLLYVNKTWFRQDNNQLAIKVRFDIYLNPFDNDEGPIYIEYNVQEFPNLDDWYCGDTHYHSEYTDTNFAGGVWGELGAPIGATLMVGEMLDLDWLAVTDHSNSFNAHTSDDKRWSNFYQDCNSYSNCLIGEEINCRTPESGNWLGNSLPENHFLAYNIDDGFLDNGQNDVPYCKEIIDSVYQQGGFGYVAHPESEIDYILLDILMPWYNYSLPYTGLEIWNGEISEDLEEGLKKWKSLLLESRKLFISAGSDAHGELNTKFAKERTCCYTPYYSKSNIFSALENGNCYMGNNGALIFEIDDKKIGEESIIINGSEVNLEMKYYIIDKCGLYVYEGIIGNDKEEQYYLGNIYPLTNPNIHEFNINNVNSDRYYRLECISDDGKSRIYTNPIWINVVECIEDYDCDDNDEYTFDTCVNPGNKNSYCEYENIICLNNIDCGNDSYIGDRYCKDKDVYQKYQEFECINPRTVDSSCFSNIYERLVKECEFGCIDGECRPSLCNISLPTNNTIYNNRRIPFEIKAIETMNKIEYIDYSDRRPRWKLLCNKCDEYNKEKSFNEGYHNIFVKCIDYHEEKEEHEINFFNDYKNPRISRTYPKRNSFTNGSDFMVKYTEENVKNVIIKFSPECVPGGCGVKAPVNLSNCSSGRNQECSINLDLSDIDEHEIEYYFVVGDIAGNKDESKPTKVKVDTTSPVLNNQDSFWMQGTGRYNKYIYFNFNITEENFDEVSYYDNSDRRPKWKRLCSRLKNNVCDAKKSFRRGDHSVDIQVVDEAGNSIGQHIDFIVDY